MGRKVFVSYKYADESVTKLKDAFFEIIDGKWQWNWRNTRVRDYVDLLQEKIGNDNTNLGEKDSESLEDFSDQYIETELKKRIRQCSVTIVMISKGMKTFEQERNQWIPWEISYSLRTVPTGSYTKQINAVLGIVLPDEYGNYDWYYRENPNCNSVTHFTGQLFKILQDNMFNILDKEFRDCNDSKIYVTNEPSFIKTVKWNDFMAVNKYNDFIDKAIEIKNNKKLYDVHINLN